MFPDHVIQVSAMSPKLARHACDAMSRPSLPAAAIKTLQFIDFGGSLVAYSDGLSLQKSLAEGVKTGNLPDTLVQLQHSPVYTLGKRGRAQDFKTPVEKLRDLGAEVTEISRGGETTFHGPGQLVLYPIVNLRRLKRGARAYVEGLEDCVIDALRGFGISAKGQQPGRTGVWIEDRKIAAIGVQISGGTSMHGLAVNVVNDLTFFNHIVPCGIADKEVTSVTQEVGDRTTLKQVSDALRSSFVREFGYNSVIKVNLDGES